MSENTELETNIIETVDEDGNTVELEILDIIDVEGVEYAILKEVSENDDTEEEEAVLMRIIRDGEEYIFEAIEDDEEFNIVAEYIESLGEEAEEE